MVAIANGLFVQNGMPVKDGFLRTLAAQYGAGARLVDFPSGQAADQINTWVRTQTAQRITKLFDRLDPLTRLVLANAVYLKADWQSPFSMNPTTGAPVHPRRQHDSRGADDAPAGFPALCQRPGLAGG